MDLTCCPNTQLQAGWNPQFMVSDNDLETLAPGQEKGMPTTARCILALYDMGLLYRTDLMDGCPKHHN